MLVDVRVVRDPQQTLLARGNEQGADGAVEDVVARVEQPAADGHLAETAVEIGGDGHGRTSFLDGGPGRGRLACRIGARVERRRDLVVGQVVAVAEHDGGPLLGGQAVGELAEILVGRTGVLVWDLGDLARRSCAAMHVDRNPRGDRQHPGAEMLTVLQAVVRAQRPEERLLERVVGPVATDLAAEQAENLGLCWRRTSRTGGSPRCSSSMKRGSSTVL